MNYKRRRNDARDERNYFQTHSNSSPVLFKSNQIGDKRLEKTSTRDFHEALIIYYEAKRIKIKHFFIHTYHLSTIEQKVFKFSCEKELKIFLIATKATHNTHIHTRARTHATLKHALCCKYYQKKSKRVQFFSC